MRSYTHKYINRNNEKYLKKKFHLLFFKYLIVCVQQFMNLINKTFEIINTFQVKSLIKFQLFFFLNEKLRLTNRINGYLLFKKFRNVVCIVHGRAFLFISMCTRRILSLFKVRLNVPIVFVYNYLNCRDSQTFIFLNYKFYTHLFL